MLHDQTRGLGPTQPKAPIPPDANASFQRLRELSMRIPEGTQELLPIIDFLETFPDQVTEEALIHLVGVTALGIAKASQGGLWSGSRWLFLRGNAPAFPTHPGPGWSSRDRAGWERPWRRPAGTATGSRSRSRPGKPWRCPAR